MKGELNPVVLLVSMLGTYAILLLVSKKFREDHVKMFRMEKTTLRVAIGNPIAALVFLLSFIIPVLL